MLLGLTQTLTQLIELRCTLLSLRMTDSALKIHVGLHQLHRSCQISLLLISPSQIPSRHCLAVAITNLVGNFHTSLKIGQGLVYFAQGRMCVSKTT